MHYPPVVSGQSSQPLPGTDPSEVHVVVPVGVTSTGPFEPLYLVPSISSLSKYVSVANAATVILELKPVTTHDWEFVYAAWSGTEARQPSASNWQPSPVIDTDVGGTVGFGVGGVGADVGVGVGASVGESVGASVGANVGAARVCGQIFQPTAATLPSEDHCIVAVGSKFSRLAAALEPLYCTVGPEKEDRREGGSPKKEVRSNRFNFGRFNFQKLKFQRL